MVVELLEVGTFERTVDGGIEPIGTGARFVGSKPAGTPITICLVLFDDAGVDDHHDRNGRQKWSIGLIENEAHRRRVRRGDVVRLQHRFEGARRRLADRQHALEAVDDILGGDFAAVVEFGAGAQLEFPGQTVGAHAVRLRQPRLELWRIALIAIEIVIGVEAKKLHGHVEDLMRIDVRRQVVSRYQDAGAGSIGARGHQEPCGCRHRAGQRHPPQHGAFSLASHGPSLARPLQAPSRRVQACLLCAIRIDTTASAVLSAAITGLTTGTPTRSLKASHTPGRNAMLMQPSASTSAPSSTTATRAAPAALSSAPGVCLASSITDRPTARTEASSGPNPSARSRAAMRP